MRLQRHGAAAVLVSAALVAGCAPNVTVPGGSPFERDDFRFVAPTGWEVRPTTEAAFAPSRHTLYLANQPLQDDCAAVGTEFTCHPPIDGGLRNGGMLVTWIIQPCVARSCDLPGGKLIAVGNRQGVRVAVADGCAGIGHTEGSAYFVTVTPQRVDVLVICARDASDRTRSALLGFLDAIEWRIP